MIFEGPFSNTKIDDAKKKSEDPVVEFHHESSSSSTVIKPGSGKRRPLLMTGEQRTRYRKQVYESEGFDVEDFSEYMYLDMIVPVKGNIERKREFKQWCNSAIKYFVQNVNQEAKLKLVRVVKANARGGGIWEYFITFEAIDAADGDQVKTFQTVVAVDYVNQSSIEVDFCRQKLPPPQLPSSS